MAPPGLPSSAAAHAPDGFRRSFHRGPAAAHVSATGIRVTRRGSCSAKHGEEPKRDRMGTDSEPRSLRIEPDGERLGTEWGLGPLTIEQTTEDMTAIHRLAASRLRRATATSPPAAGPGTGRRSAGRRRTVREASRTSDQDGPEPGHLMTEARSERTEAGGALRRRANGTGAPARTAEVREGALCRMAEGEFGRRPEEAVRAARREVSTGTN